MTTYSVTVAALPGGFIQVSHSALAGLYKTSLTDLFIADEDLFESACTQLESQGFIVDREAKTFRKPETISTYTIVTCSLSAIVDEIVEPLGIDPERFDEELSQFCLTGSNTRALAPMRYVGDALRASCDGAETEARAQKLLMSAVPGVDYVEMDR